MLKRLCLAVALALGTCVAAAADDYVRGYVRKDGTYVSGYYRSSPDTTVRNNYSYYGNTNPYTGSTGTNRYYSSPSSEYYNPYRSSYGSSSYGSSSYGSSYGLGSSSYGLGSSSYGLGSSSYGLGSSRSYSSYGSKSYRPFGR